ncbi:snoRNP complex protein nop56 [Orobanche hederae]
MKNVAGGGEVRPVHLLFECATGYALLLANGIAEVDLFRFKKVEEYINRSPQPLELKAYLPFSSLDDALVEMKAVSTSNVTEKLKQFLLDHAPKPTNLLHIGTSDPFMGHQIVLGTGMGARHSVLIRNVMRALRDKTDQFLCLQPGQLERAQMDLARLYINQRRTGMYADSPLVISSSPSSIQEQVGVVPHRFKDFSVSRVKRVSCAQKI